MIQVYTLGQFLPNKKKGQEDLVTGVMKIKGEDIFKGNIVGIGGEYNSRYAIIQ